MSFLQNIQTGLPTALVTGATGFIGRWLVPTLTAAGQPVVAAIREATTRADELRRWTAGHGGRPELVTFVEHDLLRPFAPPESAVREVACVFHLAASYAWGLDPVAAAKANVDGALAVLRWAATRNGLRRFVLVAGYRVALSRAAPGAGGAYESSKRDQHDQVIEEAERLGVPWTVLNPSAVMGDSRTGETTQFIGPAELFRLLFERRLPALPGSRDTFVPLVPVDHVARFAAAAALDPAAARQSYWLLDDATPLAPDLVRVAARHLGVPAPRLSMPLGLARRLPRALTGADPESLEFMGTERYDVSSARAFSRRHGLVEPAAAAALPAWLDALVARRFGAGPAEAPTGRMENGVWVRRHGEGEPTLLLHGLALDGEAWAAVAASTPGQHIVPDLPGLGRSGAGDPLDPRWLDDLTEPLVAPAVVVGHSLGTALAVELAHRHPERVRALVLVAPYFLQRPPPLWLRSRGAVWLALTLMSRRRLAASLHPSGLAHPAVASALALLDRRGGRGAVARALVAAQAPERRARLRELVGRLRVPVQVVAGSRDPVTSAPAGMAVAVIPDAGHNPMLTHPEPVAAVVRALLASPRHGALRPVRA